MIEDGLIYRYDMKSVAEFKDVARSVVNKEQLYNMALPFGTILVSREKTEHVDELKLVVIRDKMNIPVKFKPLNSDISHEVASWYPPMAFIITVKKPEEGCNTIRIEPYMIKPGMFPQNPMPGTTIELFKPPFPNIYDDGRLCHGLDTIDSIQEVIEAFYTKPFNTDLFSDFDEVYDVGFSYDSEDIIEFLKDFYRNLYDNPEDFPLAKTITIPEKHIGDSEWKIER